MYLGELFFQEREVGEGTRVNVKMHGAGDARDERPGHSRTKAHAHKIKAWCFVQLLVEFGVSRGYITDGEKMQGPHAQSRGRESNSQPWRHESPL